MPIPMPTAAIKRGRTIGRMNMTCPRGITPPHGNGLPTLRRYPDRTAQHNSDDKIIEAITHWPECRLSRPAINQNVASGPALNRGGVGGGRHNAIATQMPDQGSTVASSVSDHKRSN